MTGAIPVFDWRGEYADSPSWDHRTNVLFWVETVRHVLHFYVFEDGWHDEYLLLEIPSTVLPAFDTETVVVGEGNNTDLYDLAKHRFDVIGQVPSPDNRTRINTGKCDPSGRIWVGTTPRMVGGNLAGIYRIDPDGQATPFIKDIPCSSGLGWSPDGRVIYNVNSAARCVDAFDYDDKLGAITDQRACIALSSEKGVPGGMCVDIEGKVWVAITGGSAIVCCDPVTGAVVERVRVPVSRVTSCCIGGPNMDILFITTAKNPEPNEPLAGSILQLALPKSLGVPVTPAATGR